MLGRYFTRVGRLGPEHDDRFVTLARRGSLSRVLEIVNRFFVPPAVEPQLDDVAVFGVGSPPPASWHTFAAPLFADDEQVVAGDERAGRGLPAAAAPGGVLSTAVSAAASNASAARFSVPLRLCLAVPGPPSAEVKIAGPRFERRSTSGAIGVRGWVGDAASADVARRLLAGALVSSARSNWYVGLGYARGRRPLVDGRRRRRSSGIGRRWQFVCRLGGTHHRRGCLGDRGLRRSGVFAARPIEVERQRRSANSAASGTIQGK